MRWQDKEAVAPGVQRQLFRLAVKGRDVPGVLFTPTVAAGLLPLVLYQHGGSQHKLGEATMALVQRFVARRGFALAALDGPVHGERRGGDAQAQDAQRTAEDFRALWRAGGSIAPFVADWRAAIDALMALPQIDASALAWVGWSMGTAYGVPLLAAEPRISAAVLGLWGADYPASDEVLRSAAGVGCAVLFQQKWDDEVMTREGQLALFDALATADKRLRAYSGGHANPAGEALGDIEHFVARQLRQRQSLARRARGAGMPLSHEQATSRVGRFAQLVPTVERQYKQNGIPRELYEQLSAHRTYVMMAPRGLGGPISGGAGVAGGDDGEVVRVGMAICPPGNGPALHVHMDTHETFINTQGRWEVCWGEQGEHSTVLERYDIFACPPGVFRRFRNIAEQESHLMVIIQGDRDSFDDVYQCMESKHSLVAQYGPEIVERIRPGGLRFIDELARSVPTPLQEAA